MIRASRALSIALATLTGTGTGIVNGTGGIALAQQNNAEFDRVYQAGIDAYHLGQYEQARKLFEQARALNPRLPGPHRQLAQVAFSQGRFSDCVISAAKAIEVRPESDRSQDVRDLHALCRTKLDRKPLLVGLEPQQGALAVTSNVEGAAIAVNELSVGATPLEPRPMLRGPITVEISRTGYLPGRAKAVIVAGLVTDVDIQLKVDPSYRAPFVKPEETFGKGWLRIVSGVNARTQVDGKSPELDRNERAALDPGVHEVRVEADGYEPWKRRVLIAEGQLKVLSPTMTLRSENNRRRIIAWTALGAAAAAASTGFALSIAEIRTFERAQDLHQREVNRPSNFPIEQTGALETVATREDLEDLRDKGERLSTMATISYGVAAAAFGVGIYFLVRSRRSERPGLPLPFATLPARGPGGGVAVVTRDLRW